MGEVLKQFAEEAKMEILKAVLPLLKPMLKKLAKEVVFAQLKEAAAKTSTPIDDMLYTAAEPAIEKMIDDLKIG
jgi:hypothetical protein